MINLSQFIADGGISNYLSELSNYQIVISDFLIEEDNTLFQKTTKIQIGPGEKNLVEVQEILKLNPQKVLIMSTHLGIEQWIPILQQQQEYCLINAFTGIGSYGKKHAPELKDLSLLKEHHLTPLVIFPSDEESFLYALQKPTQQKYIRLSNSYLPINKYQWNATEDELAEVGFIDQSLVRNHYILNLKEHSKPQATILFTGDLFTQAVTVQTLAEEAGAHRDILVGDIFEKEQIQTTLLHSLKKSKNLFFVSDQDPFSAKSLLEEYVESKIAFTALSPSYNQLSTLLEDYQYQQASFEGEDIYQKLSKFIQI